MFDRIEWTGHNKIKGKVENENTAEHVSQMSLRTTFHIPHCFMIHPLRTDLFNSSVIHKPTTLKTMFKH